MISKEKAWVQPIKFNKIHFMSSYSVQGPGPGRHKVIRKGRGPQAVPGITGERRHSTRNAKSTTADEL